MFLYGRYLNGQTVMKMILYCRVSTTDQTLEHQVTQARAAGFAIDEVVSDNGVSGISTRLAERDQGKRLFDLLRRGDVLVVRWIDRLGRNYADVTEVIRQFMKRGIVVRTVINGLVFDGATKNPMQMAVRDALISFMAAPSQAQAEATQEAPGAGMQHPKTRCRWRPAMRASRLWRPSRRRKPRRPKKRSAPVSSTPRPVMTLTAAGSRPSRASNWIRSATC